MTGERPRCCCAIHGRPCPDCPVHGSVRDVVLDALRDVQGIVR